MSVEKKGVLRTRVSQCFELYKEGKFKEFCLALARAGDVHYEFHAQIVADAIRQECEDL